MSDTGNSHVSEAGDAEVQETLEGLRALKEKFNLVRSQHILSEAVHVGGLSDLREDLENKSDVDISLSKLEDAIDRLCIQEGAVRFSLESETIRKIRSSGVLSSELQESLASQLKQETVIASLASNISKEYAKLQNAQDNLTQTLEKYMSYEKKQRQELKEISVPEDNQKLKVQLREIRFMQLIIPGIITQIGDFIETEWLSELCKEIRDPILSVDDLQ